MKDTVLYLGMEKDRILAKRPNQEVLACLTEIHCAICKTPLLVSQSSFTFTVVSAQMAGGEVCPLCEKCIKEAEEKAGVVGKNRIVALEITDQKLEKAIDKHDAEMN